jgi:hypothetical protein
MPTFRDTVKAAWSIRNFFQLPLLQCHFALVFMGLDNAGWYLTVSIFSYNYREAEMGDIINLSIFFPRKRKIANLPDYI